MLKNTRFIITFKHLMFIRKCSEISFQATDRIIVILVGDLIPERHMLFLNFHEIV